MIPNIREAFNPNMQTIEEVKESRSQRSKRRGHSHSIRGDSKKHVYFRDEIYGKELCEIQYIEK